MGLSSDSPIELPSEDRFGLDPFARAIATSISGMQAPAGIVLAINGTWGSGKSSAINLVRHHLSAAVNSGDMVPIWFNPWWFAGADALSLSFFKELNAAIGPSLPKKFRNSLDVIGRGVSTLGPLMAAGANLKMPGSGGILSAAANFFAKITKRNATTAEKEQRAIFDALRSQPRKFLVIIDDIDRLSPDDALTMFRLVKSVGRLPNVIYLLAFDQLLAERVVSEKFPSEGANYLDKIIQTSFDIPPPSVNALRNQVLSASVNVFGEPDEVAAVRFMNVFYDVVAPAICTPRDAVRLVNNVSTTWPAVASNVDRADFLAIASIRLNAPRVYNAIRGHSAELCGVRGERDGRSDQEVRASYDSMLCINDFDDEKKEAWRRRLRRLFPRLDAVWSNTWHTDAREWQRDRRVCSIKHFPTYFAFAVPEDVIPAEEMRDILSHAGDPAFIRQLFRDNLTRIRSDGTSRAALLIEELTVHAAAVEEVSIASFVATLFSIADELDIPRDENRGFGFSDNPLRIHWLLNQLIHDRFDQARREQIYQPAVDGAAVAWVVDFSSRCHRYFEPRDDGRDLGEPIVGEAVADQFVSTSLSKLRAAAHDGVLISNRRLPSLLFSWQRLSDRGAAEVRQWTDSQMSNPQFVVAMARAIASVSWTQGLGWDGMGDRVARRVVRVDPAPYQDLLDVDALEARIDSLLQTGNLEPDDRSVLETYRTAPRGRRNRD